jgi:hypothetical protein
MTAAGSQVLNVGYGYVGRTESPPNSNLCSPFTDAWGPGAWCAMFTSYCNAEAGYPYPPINGPAGLSYCPDGQVYAFTTGHSVGVNGVEEGDSLIFSWEPWYYGNDGVAYCAYGVYAGAPAGDHIGLFVRWLDGNYMVTLEGNTSQSSWDNGGAVMERFDRHTGQICCYARHAALGSGGGVGIIEPPRQEEDEDDMMRMVVQVGGGGKHGDGTVWAISPNEPKAWPIATQYTVDVMHAHGVLMKREQMIEKGYTFETDGNSITTTYEVMPILESVPDQ